MALLSVLFTFFFVQVNAQNRIITGNVTAEQDAVALPGVSVVVKGTTNGTSTDIDGNYSIELSTPGGVLMFSSIGMETQEITIGTSTIINVSMKTVEIVEGLPKLSFD